MRHARFAIENGLDPSCNASITAVTIVTPGQRWRIDDVYVYTLPDYDEVTRPT